MGTSTHKQKKPCIVQQAKVVYNAQYE